MQVRLSDDNEALVRARMDHFHLSAAIVVNEALAAVFGPQSPPAPAAATETPAQSAQDRSGTARARILR